MAEHLSQPVSRAADGALMRPFTARGWRPELAPAIRAMPAPVCPYCGAASLIESWTDLRADTVHVDLYCNNSNCAAREIVILAHTRGEAGQRADLDALADVDRGPATKRNPTGLHWPNDASLLDFDEQDTLRRRQGQHIPCDCEACRAQPPSRRPHPDDQAR